VMLYLNPGRRKHEKSTLSDCAEHQKTILGVLAYPQGITVY